MAFHYQNLLLEKEIHYPEFQEHYPLIQKEALKKLNSYEKMYHVHTYIKIRLANDRITNPTIRLNENERLTLNRVEKLLLATNIVFDNNEKFLDVLKTYNVQMENCIELKTVLNELDKKDKDFLDGTINGLVHHYIPTWDMIKEYYGIKNNDDIILTKLLEISYLYPELLEKSKQK